MLLPAWFLIQELPCNCDIKRLCLMSMRLCLIQQVVRKYSEKVRQMTCWFSVRHEYRAFELSGRGIAESCTWMGESTKSNDSGAALGIKKTGKTSNYKGRRMQIEQMKRQWLPDGHFRWRRFSPAVSKWQKEVSRYYWDSHTYLCGEWASMSNAHYFRHKIII